MILIKVYIDFKMPQVKVLYFSAHLEISERVETTRQNPHITSCRIEESKNNHLFLSGSLNY